MTIAQSISELENIEARLRGGLNNVVAAEGANLCADIADRVINKGVSADGTQFSAYSTKEVAAFRYLGRSLNAGGEAKIKAAAKKREGVSYREFRDYNNRETAFKNFSFTNEMWRGLGVKKATFTGGSYILVIGGKTKASEDKIDWMEGQEGKSIIEPNGIELNRLAKAISAYILK
jgi:hypothetical protein